MIIELKELKKESMEQRKSIKRVTIEVGDELHKEIKKKSADRMVSITTYVIGAIVEKIKKEAING